MSPLEEAMWNLAAIRDEVAGWEWIPERGDVLGYVKAAEEALALLLESAPFPNPTEGT